MRQAWIAVSFALTVLILASPARAFPNEPTGFRGIEWGTPFGQAHGIYLTDHVAGDRVSYRRSFEDLSLNGIPLDHILYDFYKGRFEEAVIVAERHHGSDLLQIFVARYGTPMQEKKRKNRFFWLGDAATIILNCTGRYVTCTAVISSNAMVAQDKAAMAASARNADKDF